MPATADVKLQVCGAVFMPYLAPETVKLTVEPQRRLLRTPAVCAAIDIFVFVARLLGCDPACSEQLEQDQQRAHAATHQAR